MSERKQLFCSDDVEILEISSPAVPR